MFAAYGLPAQVVSDNGLQFKAEQFANFMQVNGIKHIKGVQFHPALNSAVERLVQTFKKVMKCSKDTYSNSEQAFASFLLTTPHSITNESCSLVVKCVLKRE